MPIHMEGAVAPAAACPANVSHRKAPGAMSAIAFIVRPVRPRVDFISTEAWSAIMILLRNWSSVVVPLVLLRGGRLLISKPAVDVHLPTYRMLVTQNRNPNSTTLRVWLGFVPNVPKASPGV